MSDPKAVIQHLFDELYNNKRLETITDIVAPDFKDRTPFHGMDDGINGLEYFIQSVTSAFPDNQLTIEQMLVDGDKVAVRWTSHNTHTGSPFLNVPASGNAITVTGTTIYRVENGKVVEMWHNEDLYGMLQQLGVIPQSSE
jgi:steroid delta-isomerase-like uncharacterized protein